MLLTITRLTIRRTTSAVRFLPVGPEHDRLGPPTQMGVFLRKDQSGG
jgi:hypothetical protein